ncbi:MAG: type II toxin-antitoxin system VapB family antitoxin [Proteobacteria bacterium]|nr:type II toxin-antitoxin system VapB family antitoxin [Pseudomonadota bacterium]
MNIKDEQTHEKAGKLAELTGESMTKAVTKATDERLSRIGKANQRSGIAEKLNRLAAYCSSLPVLDGRSDDDIIGYDESGLPK